ncbi:MAG: TRAP transporter substrate-binding protein DctP [Carboxydocellales bacterium]
MKNARVLRLVTSGIVLLSMVVLFSTGCSSSEEKNKSGQNQSQVAEPKTAITLQMISFLPKNDPLVAVIPKWIEKVETATGKQVLINWKGGPEIIPAMEQIEALRNGIVDINFNVSAYYEPLAPETRAFSLSEFTPWEERENGFYNYMAERHKKMGAIYLGRWLGEQPFYLWLNQPVQKPEELKGKSFRTRALYDRFMKELGIAPVSVDHGEVYTALERGIVQGFGWPILGPQTNGWTEKTKYLIDHPFYNQNATILINPKSMEKLSPELQKQVLDATAEFEHDMIAYFKEASEKEKAILKEKGVTFIKFSTEDAERYLNTAYNTEWKYLGEKVPDLVQDLKKLSSKGN